MRRRETAIRSAALSPSTRAFALSVVRARFAASAAATSLFPKSLDSLFYLMRNLIVISIEILIRI
jgi:hypothetical protein